MRTHNRSEPARVLLADPPWCFGDKLPGKTRGAAKNYEVMSVDDICAFPMPEMAEDSVLLLWRVAAMQEDALLAMRAWGFIPKAEIVWVKTTGADVVVDQRNNATGLSFGMGRYVRNCHEVCLIGARGRASKLTQSHSVRSVFFAPVGEHSAKPDAFYDLVEALFPGPRHELFARRRRTGWVQEGLELPPL